MRSKTWFKVLLLSALVVTSLPTWSNSITNATEPKQEVQEVALPVKKISDFRVDGSIRIIKDGKETYEQKRYTGPLSEKEGYYKEHYDSIFTRFSNVKAQINEDAGAGNIITKIEFLKGNEVVQTQTVNSQKYKADVLLKPEIVPVQSTKNISPSGATISFKLVGKKWVMWNSSSWMQEDKSKRVTPTKFDSGIDAYPGTFFTHLASFPRAKSYLSEMYPGLGAFNEKLLDENESVLDRLNKNAVKDKGVEVELTRKDIAYRYYGEDLEGSTYRYTDVKDLKITDLGHAGIYFTQYYDHSGYYKSGKELMVYLSSYIYTINAQSYRYPDRIKVYVSNQPIDKPKDPDCTEERGQVIDGKDLDPNVSAVIRADQRGSEQFDVLQGIPTSESLYGNVIAKNYLYQNKFVQITGKCTFEVKVNKKFTLKWDPTKPGTDANGKPITLPDPQTDEEVVPKVYKVERPYSYWIIDNLEVYQINQAKLENYAFDGEEIWLSPENYDPPIYSTAETHGYVRPEYEKEVHVDGPTRDGGTKRPVVSGEEFPEEAEKVVGKMKVTNDTLIFEGATVINPAQTEVNGPTPSQIKVASQIDKDVLYSPYNMIPNTKVNQASQPSTGTIYYGIMSGNINGGEDKEFPINGINPITVHTPVVLYADVSDDKAHNQKTVPAQNRQAIILERPFTVYLPNSGQHTNYKGYGSRDYGKYIRNKQVKFPFDVYDIFRTTFYPKGTWIDVASYEEEVEFYLPVWVDEGFYDIEMRTIAENAPEVTPPQHEQDANLNLIHHIAYDTVPVDVIGRLYDFHVTDIADYNWETVFRMKQGSPLHTGRTYWVGTQDIDGEPRYDLAARYTLPIRPGSHPEFKNLVTKTGYHFKFELKTKGNMFGKEDGITIQPTFVFISSSTGERTPVDLYYHTDQASFIRIGSKEDTESKYVILNERLRNVPEVELEDSALYQYDREKTFAEIAGMSRAGYVQNYKTKTTKLKTPVGGYNGLYLTAPIRTLIGPKEEIPETVDRYRANAAIQKWYGEYSLPADVYAVKAGTNIAEYGRTHQGISDKSPIFLKDGYIVVNFDISSVQKGQKNAPHLQYIHAKLMNQWKQMEGFKVENLIDPYGRKLDVKDGDVLFYDAKYSSRNDFLPTVTH